MTRRLVVLIFGPRDLFPSLAEITARFDRLFARFLPCDVTIMHGDARGVDRCGRDFCHSRCYAEDKNPYLSEFGEAGGPLRNIVQANKLRDFREAGADVFGMGWRWSKWTPGTQDMAENLDRVGVKYQMREVAR